MRAGVKGLGELVLMGVAPAIANAVFNATGRRGAQTAHHGRGVALGRVPRHHRKRLLPGALPPRPAVGPPSGSRTFQNSRRNRPPSSAEARCGGRGESFIFVLGDEGGLYVLRRA